MIEIRPLREGDDRTEFQGVSDPDVDLMMRKNPAKLFGLAN